MKVSFRPRFVLVCAVASTALLSAGAAPSRAADPVLDLESLTGLEAKKMMEEGKLTSVQLTRAYVARIEALNKRGPGLNAVTQYNKDALKDAAQADAERALGAVRGPAHGLPILLKDLIDVKGMYTSNGNFSLRNSFPAEDSGVAKKLRASGVVILGKLGLSEYANSFGSQPSGFSNLTGQVIHGLDADQNPSGSSSGSGTAGAAAMSALVVGTETSGSIISPSTAQSLVGIRPTVGLVPGYGIGPISASQDTAGPMDRTVSDAALTLQSIAGRDPKNEEGYKAFFGEDIFASITQAPSPVPDYLSALDLDFVDGKRIGWNNDLDPNDGMDISVPFTPGTPSRLAFDALEAAGAIMVVRPLIRVEGVVPDLPPGYQQHKSINEYYKNLGPQAPINSLAEEVADNELNSFEALKFGNGNHVNSLAAEIAPGGPNETAYRDAMPKRRAAQWLAIDRMMSNDNADPSDDFLAILGSVPSGATAGTPQITIPMGYTQSNRRAQGVNIHGNRLSERNLIGVAYVIEQGTKLRQPASALNPSMYRCAKTVPAPPFAARGGCNPDFPKIMAAVGTPPALPFALETESAQDLQERMTDDGLTAETLTRAFLHRIALSNAEGPATQAVRGVDLGAIETAKALDAERARDGRRSPLHGLGVLVDDSIDVAGMPTTAGSIALQDSTPAEDSEIVAKLRAAGAIVLGKTNVTELNGTVDSDMPKGYSALGGQVLLPGDTDKTTNGSSAGSAAAAASGLAAFAVGLQTSPETASLTGPADVAGVVGLKPTVGRVSRDGVLGVARSQDSPGPIARSVHDVTAQLQAMAGTDDDDPGTASAPRVPNYLAALSTTALTGKRVAVVTNSTPTYTGAVAELSAQGATPVTRTIGTPTPNPVSIVTREFKRDLNAYLADVPGAGPATLQEVIATNMANPVEGLKYQQDGLATAQATDLTGDALTAYEADRDMGIASNRAVIDTMLDGGTPETTDDAEVIMVPAGSPLVAVADRAGYPVLTVPAGFGTGNAGRNPIGVTFVAGAFAESALLAAGFDYEQATKVRLPPSRTNPSMWRCVAGSDFFSPHHCHPGDLRARDVFAADVPAVPEPGPAPAPGPAPSPGPAPGSGSAPGSPAPKPTGPKGKPLARPTISKLNLRAVRSGRMVSLSFRCSRTAGTRCKGSVRLVSGRSVLARRSFSIAADRTTRVRVILTRAAYRKLVQRKRMRVGIEVVTRGADGVQRRAVVRVTLRPPAAR